jgi:hypothetical protein
MLWFNPWGREMATSKQIYLALCLFAWTAFGVAAEAKPKAALAFEISDFHTSLEKYKLVAHGLVRVTDPRFKDRILALRVNYTVRVSQTNYVESDVTLVVIKDGAGLMKFTVFPPDPVIQILEAKKDNPQFEWSAQGWYPLEPATIK